MSDYNQAVRLEPSNADRYRDRGDAYSNHKDYEQAIADFNEAIRLKPKQRPSTMADEAGSISIKKIMFTRSPISMRQSISMRKTPRTFDGRGRTYKALKNNQHALDDFSEAVKLEPTNFDYLANRARINFDLKEI